MLGPSGAGKTTLFRALVGEVPLASGRIELDGRDVSTRAALATRPPRHRLRPSDPERALGSHGRREPRDVRVARSRPPTRSARARGPSRWSSSDRLDGPRRGAVGRRTTATRARAGARRQADGARLRRALCRHRPRRARSGWARCCASGPSAGTAVVLADHHVAEALRVCDRAILLVDGRDGGFGAPGRRFASTPGRRQVPGIVDANAATEPSRAPAKRKVPRLIGAHEPLQSPSFGRTGLRLARFRRFSATTNGRVGRASGTGIDMRLSGTWNRSPNDGNQATAQAEPAAGDDAAAAAGDPPAAALAARADRRDPQGARRQPRPRRRRDRPAAARQHRPVEPQPARRPSARSKSASARPSGSSATST